MGALIRWHHRDRIALAAKSLRRRRISLNRRILADWDTDRTAIVMYPESRPRIARATRIPILTTTTMTAKVRAKATILTSLPWRLTGLIEQTVRGKSVKGPYARHMGRFSSTITSTSTPPRSPATSRKNEVPIDERLRQIRENFRKNHKLDYQRNQPYSSSSYAGLGVDSEGGSALSM